MPRGSKPFFTPEQDLDVAARYKAGETLRQIGASYGVTWRPVSSSLLRSGITPRTTTDYHWKPTPENTAEVERLWHEGLGVQKIARRAGTGNDVVSRVLRERGVQTRYGGQNHRFKGEQIATLITEYEAGASLNQLSRRHGGSAVVVRNTLQRNGVQLREKNSPLFWSPERLTWLKAQYEADRSEASIAAELELSQAAVSKRLRSIGLLARQTHPSGPSHPGWKGGTTTRGGYTRVMLPDNDPMVSMRNSSGYVPEHRLVMARKLGRPLLPSETPHHKNLLRSDNSPDNLELWLTSQPSGARVADLIEWSLGLLDQYMPEVLVPGWRDQRRPEDIT